ncbi:MAG: D-alanyl-D-alanine carboxypeptidase [Burkholderiaceae bacterium]
MVALLRGAGLQQIDGDLLVDDALFAPTPSGGTIDGLVSEPYNVEPIATLMNFKSTKFVVSPGKKQAQIVLDPPLAGVPIENRVKLVGGPCRYAANSLSIDQRGDQARPTLRVSGRYSRACRERWSYFAVLDHRQFIEAFFRGAWEAGGGSWKGHARMASGAAARLNRAPWQVWTSPRTLAEVIGDVNKFSNNVMTRMLLMQLASHAGAVPATEALGRHQVEGWLKLNQLPFPGLVLDNGAGLSRQARLDAGGLTGLLVAMGKGPYADLLRESLPVLGRDGTLRWRLADEPVAGRAWLKTGSLADVRSIAGYLDARSGERYALTLIINGPIVRRATEVQDELLRWLYENG